MKRKLDDYIWPKGMYQTVTCDRCGIVSTDQSALVFWRSLDGQVLCSNCNCLALTDSIRELQQENTFVHETALKNNSNLLDKSLEMERGFNQHLTKLLLKIDQLEARLEKRKK